MVLAFRYIHTLSGLRLTQILYRLCFLFRKKIKFFYKIINSVPKAFELQHIKPKVPFLSYAWFNADEIVNGQFTFLNDTVDFKNEIDWKIRNKPHLWRYNLHYFQYLHPPGGLNVRIGLSLMMDWIKQNPLGSLDSWDPYSTSLRIVNWIKYISKISAQHLELKAIFRSLYQQSLWLERFLEYDQLGNHLIKNLKALIFAGLFFKSNDANRWLSKGLNLIKLELDEQILADGGHIERSTMYQSMILEDCMDLFNTIHDHSSIESHCFINHLERLIPKMLYFLIGMTHPDNKISLFNDSAHGIEAPLSDLTAYYERLKLKKVDKSESRLWQFPITGYFIMSPHAGDRLIIDCGPIGPDYQPGHGHCDTLSFELSLNGKRVIVDSGCFSYEDNEMRQYNRGNSGHNILTLDDENQSEVWSSFRCARRAKPLKPRLWDDSNGMIFEGGHDGYKRLIGKPTHIRKIQWQKDLLNIEDRVIGQGKHKYTSRLHFNPTCEIIIKREIAMIKWEHRLMMIIKPVGMGKLHLEQGWYCPEFGKRYPCPVLSFESYKNLPLRLGWKIIIFKN